MTIRLRDHVRRGLGGRGLDAKNPRRGAGVLGGAWLVILYECFVILLGTLVNPLGCPITLVICIWFLITVCPKKVRQYLDGGPSTAPAIAMATLAGIPSCPFPENQFRHQSLPSCSFAAPSPCGGSCPSPSARETRGAGGATAQAPPAHRRADIHRSNIRWRSHRQADPLSPATVRTCRTSNGPG